MPRAFGGFDWVVVAAYALGFLGIAVYFARRQHTTEEYFLAGRNKRPFLPGISTFAAVFTILSYIAIPGELVGHGPVIVCIGVAALPITYLAVGYLLMPAIMRLPITSAYELLDARLGRRVRLLGSGTFVCIRLIWMAIMLYIASTLLVRVTGWDARMVPYLALGIGVATTIYTFIGGIDAVMLTAGVQFFILLLGAILTIVSISWRMGGVLAWWPHHWQSYWAPEPLFSVSPLVRVTVFGSIITNLIFSVCVSGSDQVLVQRYLTTRDARTARRSFLVNNSAIAAITTTLGLVGAALLGFYTQHPEAAPGLDLAKNGDAFFPHYISHYLPVGISGLVVAGMLGAAMLAVASAINSITAVISKDFIDTFRAGAARTEAARMRTARLLALAIGAVIVILALAVSHVQGNLVEVQIKTIHLLICPLFSLFFLAMFIPFATPFGATFGAAYGVAASVVVAYWDVFTGLPRLSFQWITPCSLTASLAGGILFSLLPTRGRSRPVTAIYAVACAAPLAASLIWVARYRG